MTPELFLERGGELRIVREDFSVYVRYCYVHLSKFSFFSFFPCPFFLIFFSKQIAIPTSIYLQNLASIQPRTSPFKFARSPRTDPPGTHCSGATAAQERRFVFRPRVLRRVHHLPYRFAHQYRVRRSEIVFHEIAFSGVLYANGSPKIDSCP